MFELQQPVQGVEVLEINCEYIKSNKNNNSNANDKTILLF